MRFFLCAFILLLASCSTTDTPEPSTGGLTPMPVMPGDPPDSALKPAMQAWLQNAGAPASSRYDFKRIDLNRDGLREAVVLLKHPYGHWCEMNGCTMLVLRAGKDERFYPLSPAIRPVRAPVYAGEGYTNGWRDLIIHVSGRWSKTKDVAMKFNGVGYPADPSRLPPSIRSPLTEETRLFRD